MKKNIIKFLIKLVTDIFGGLLASVFCYFIIGYIAPEILNTSLINGAITLKFDPEILRRVFSIWHCFCILFGIRFVIAYITGDYKFTFDQLKNKNKPVKELPSNQVQEQK